MLDLKKPICLRYNYVVVIFVKAEHTKLMVRYVWSTEAFWVTCKDVVNVETLQ